MVKKTAPKLLPIVPRPLSVTTTDFREGEFKPLQIRIEPQLHREIKIAAAEQGKSMTAFLLECYDFWLSMNK
ncbi:MAG: toxin-antitoxin system HicB family antitoxin [Scandinavium sp.]|uniref:toxin-antitoxin system HicB family antitoxin n=1 Tax=Scandinavium sp. TaxID=2830653 RepID=UPI003F3BA449